MITIVPIEKDCGFAVMDSDANRVDIIPANDIADYVYIDIQEPTLTATQARKFALLLVAAADYVESHEIK